MIQPMEIFAEIEAQPPFMRTEAIQRYLGREVEWILTFRDGYESQPGQAHLMLQFASHDIRHVATTVALENYPRLKNARSGQLVQVHGRILRIGTLNIELQMIELAFCAEPADALAH